MTRADVRIRTFDDLLARDDAAQVELELLAHDWHDDDGRLVDVRYDGATRDLAWWIALGQPVTIPGTPQSIRHAMSAARYAGVPITVELDANGPHSSATAIVRRALVSV